VFDRQQLSAYFSALIFGTFICGGGRFVHMACTFVGMAKHFVKDPKSEVTAVSNLNLATFLQRPEGLVFGRKEDKGGRLGVRL
jgi:hypothetical protein